MIRAIKMKCYLKGCALVGKNTFALNICYCHLYHKKGTKIFPRFIVSFNIPDFDIQANATRRGFYHIILEEEFDLTDV